jgi:hypothetical protein
MGTKLPPKYHETKIKINYNNIYINSAQLSKIKEEDSIYFKKKSVPKTFKRYNYKVIILGGR